MVREARYLVLLPLVLLVRVLMWLSVVLVLVGGPGRISLAAYCINNVTRAYTKLRAPWQESLVVLTAASPAPATRTL